MDAKELIDRMVKDLEPIMEPEDLQKVKESYSDCKEAIQKHLDTYYPPLEQLEEKANDFVETHIPDADEEMKDLLRNVFMANYVGEFSLANVIGIDEKALNTLYTLAYNCYNHGKYKEARNYFELLVHWNENDPYFRFGFAATLHMLKEYELAQEHYLACAFLDSSNPVPWYHLIDCGIHLENWPMAMAGVKAVLVRIQGNDSFTDMKEKTLLMKDVVDKKYLEISQMKSIVQD